MIDKKMEENHKQNAFLIFGSFVALFGLITTFAPQKYEGLLLAMLIAALFLATATLMTRLVQKLQKRIDELEERIDKKS